MLRITPAWVQGRQYQIDLETDLGSVDTFTLYVVFSNKLYPIGPIGVGQSFVDLPTGVTSGSVNFHCVATDSAGTILETSRGVFAIFDADTPASDTFGAQLTRSVAAGVEYDRKITGYRMRITVTDTRGVPKKMFLFKENRDWDYDIGDEFQGVCRPGDFDKYPEEQPADGRIFYRKDYLDVTAPTSTELDELWERVRLDVRQLLHTLQLNATLLVSHVEILNGLN